MNTAKELQSQKILILGAGELGMAMLHGFISERQEHPSLHLTVLLRAHPEDERHAQRLAQFKAWGVDVITGDFNLQSESELAALFHSFDAVINCSGFVGGAGTQLKITSAVLQAEVARYFPWQFGVDYDQIGKGSGQPVWDEQWEVRQLLRQQQKTQWVIVSTGIFTSYLFEPDFGVVDFAQYRVNALGDADHALTMTMPEDIGRLTAKIFFHQPMIRDQVVFVAGDTLSYRQLVAILSEHTHHAFQLVVRTHAQLQADSQSDASNVGAAYRLAFARPTGVAWEKSMSFNAREAIAVQDVRGWLSQHINTGSSLV